MPCSGAAAPLLLDSLPFAATLNLASNLVPGGALPVGHREGLRCGGGLISECTVSP